MGVTGWGENRRASKKKIACSSQASMAKQQLKFWNSIQVYMADNPDHPLASLIEFGQQINLPYLQYYEKLEADYNDSTTCKKSLTQAIRQDIETKIRSKGGEDDGSRFGVYMLVNPSLA